MSRETTVGSTDAFGMGQLLEEFDLLCIQLIKKKVIFSSVSSETTFEAGQT